ncbi:MAG: PAC2 family protein [Euryarchaeota archaeon]|nr:PAC2 family protein [Euryarchaeota archaeon]
MTTDVHGRTPRAIVRVRDYKTTRLDGGTLIVSIPHVGDAGVLLTDFLLEQHAMDQVAGVDSDAFPPIASLRGGKPRCPMRIHADPRARVAVLRSDFEPPFLLWRSIGRGILDWAASKKIQRIVVVDGMTAQSTPNMGPPRVLFVATSKETRSAALDADLAEFDTGVVGGIGAVLLLEARFQGVDVVALYSEVREPLDDARGVVSLANALPHFVPGLHLDMARLTGDIRRVEAAVGAIRAQATGILQDLSQKESESPMYG